MVATCRTLRIGGTPTPGFTVTSDKYTNLGPFTANITINFPTQPNKTITLVSYNYPNPDTCIKDVILDSTGKATTTYNTTQTKIIYATLKVGSSCCIGFDTCTSSNYVSLNVIPIGNVTFISTPESGAEIFLASHGQTPVDQVLTTTNTINNLPVGIYDYILKKTGYNDASGNVTILEGQTITQNVPMTPAEGCIYFDSTPQMAEIWINGSASTVADTGFKTPKLICGLPLGSHVYKLTLAGYDNIIDTAQLGTGNGLIITKNLRQSPILTDITLSPINPSIVVGNTLQFNATPIDQYGDPFPATITWSNSNSFVGNIDPSTGLFTALHVGTSIVTATSGSVSKSTTVTVTQVVPVLTTITVSPSTLTIQAGNASIFTAHALDQFDNTFQTTITWTSSDTSVGTIDQNGVFNAKSQGSTVITASSGNIDGIAIVNVTPAPVISPVLTTIKISPDIASITEGKSALFISVNLDQYGNPIQATVTWSSSDTSVGTIDQSGLFTAVSSGTTIVKAINGSISGSAIVNVIPAPVLDKIIVSPSTLTIQTGNAYIFTAQSLDQFGNTFQTTITWISSDTSVGTIDQNGIFNAISAGTTTIMASSGSISGIAVVNVTAAPVISPVLTTIKISPDIASITEGKSALFISVNLDQYGNPIQATVTWSSSDTSVGTIDQSGLFTAVSSGTTIVNATSGSISGSAVVNVIPAPVLDKIIVSPSTLTIQTGNAAIFIAQTLDQFGNSISTIVTWDSSDTLIGTIGQNGVFIAKSQGSTVITASSGNINGIAIVNVTPAAQLPEGSVLAKINVSPLTLAIQVRNSSIFTAETLDQYGNIIPINVVWNSSDESIGTIDANTGVFTAKSQGSTTINATSGNISGSALVNVSTQPPVQAGIFPITGSINTAALILGMALFGVALLNRPPIIPEVKKEVTPSGEIELEKFIKRERGL